MSIGGMIRRASAALRADGWENTLLGIGGVKDPTTYTKITARDPIGSEQLEAAYVEDHFAATIVEALPFDAMRPGWSLAVQDAPDEAAKIREAYEREERRLGVAEELSQGAVWGRLFGGAITWIGADDQRQADEPLDEDRIEAVRFFRTLDKRYVQVWSYYDDPASPRYLQPESYLVYPPVMAGPGGAAGLRTAKGIVIHESRVVVWPGKPTTDYRRQALGGWDDSVLEPCWQALKEINEDFAAKSMLLGRVSQAIYKIHELYDMLAGGQQDVLEKRMDLMDRSRSRARAMLLDTREEYEQTTQPLSGVDTMIDRGLLRLAASAETPVPRLLGQPLGQMEGAGAGAHEWWAQRVKGWRERQLRPNHERVTRLILRSREGPAKGQDLNWRLNYGPLREPTAKEEQEVRKLRAETDAILIDKGLVSPEAIALQRFSPSAGGEIVLDEDTLKNKLERRKDLENQPPKDNAELGTVGARTKSVLEVIEKVQASQISRESGKATLMEIHRFQEDVADDILGPKDFEPAGPPADKPGPDPEPGMGGGAGAPQGLPGENDGGDPTEEQDPDGTEGESS